MPTVPPRRMANGLGCLRPATTLGVTHHRIRRLIKEGVLAAEQVVPPLRTKSEPTTSNTDGWLPRLGEQVGKSAYIVEHVYDREEL
jgi:hypothetical protein